MSGIQPSEVVALLIIAIGTPALYRVYAKRSDRSALMGVAYACVICSLLASVIESLVLPGLMNLLQHAFIAVAGVLFAFGIATMVRPEDREGGDS